MSESDIPNKKVVIIVDANLEKGQAANRAAVLSTGLAKHVPNMIGQNSITKDHKTILGFTQMPIPILTTRPDTSLVELANKALGIGCTVIVYLSRAQGLRSYEEYRQSISQINFNDLDIDGVALYGDRQLVIKLTGNLPALK